jgi:alpha-tubulin suppressor-like RCC1 family protein
VCLLRNPAAIVAFGYNRFGQLGVGPLPRGPWADGASFDDPDKYSAADAARAEEMLGKDWRELVGAAREWFGSLDVDMGSVAAPTPVAGLQGCSIKDVSCGLFHTLFLARPPGHAPSGDEGEGDFRVLACGNNDAGQLGLGHRVRSREERVGSKE